MKPEDYDLLLYESEDPREPGVRYWIADCREMGCIGDGPDPSAAVRFVRETIAEYLADYRRRGEVPPVPIKRDA